MNTKKHECKRCNQRLEEALMIIKLSSVTVLALLAAMPVAQAATVELTWGDPAKFRDILTAEGNQKRFQQEVYRYMLLYRW